MASLFLPANIDPGAASPNISRALLLPPMWESVSDHTAREASRENTRVADRHNTENRMDTRNIHDTAANSRAPGNRTGDNRDSLFSLSPRIQQAGEPGSEAM